MGSLHEAMIEYQRQLEKGVIQEAYQGLMEYILGLRTYLRTRHPDYYVSGSIYYGYMDMTYFSFFPESLKVRNLKVAIVFIHEKCRFEAWLAGANKQVQTMTWELFRDSGWDQYHIVPTPKGVDSIVEHTLADHPDFSDLKGLTRQIESEALNFIGDLEDFFSSH